MAARKARKDALDLYRGLVGSFQRKQFKPLYLLYGSETFLPGRVQHFLIQHALEDHERDFNLDLVYGAESDANSVLALCQLVPMMAERRVVIVRGVEQLRDSRRLAHYAKNPNPGAVVLLWCNGKPRFNSDPYRTLRKKAVCAHFEPLKAHRVPVFVNRMARQSGCRLGEGVAEALIDSVGTSLATLVNELNKLQTYVGDRESITREDVVQASGQTRDINVFELQDALAARKREESLRICDQLLVSASNAQSESIAIVYALTTYFLRLWKLHGAAGPGKSSRVLAKEIGAPFWLIEKQLRALRYWPGQELIRVLGLLLSAETELKGGSQRSPRIIMTLMLNNIFI